MSSADPIRSKTGAVPSTNCFCGFEIAGDDRDAQVAVGYAHFSEMHPEIGTSETGIRNFLEREEMLTGGVERIEDIGSVEVVDLTPERLDDVLAFFDHDAFADFPGWAACYCMAHHVEDEAEFQVRSWQRNREDLVARINAGKTTGTLAYVDGKLAGWCNASARAEYPHYARGTDDDTTGVVTCFVIAAPYRRHGLAKSLLDGAIDQFQRRGMSAVEAHCATVADNAAKAYRGTIPLYEAAGFTVVYPGEQTTVMRREL